MQVEFAKDYKEKLSYFTDREQSKFKEDDLPVLCCLYVL